MTYGFLRYIPKSATCHLCHDSGIRRRAEPGSTWQDYALARAGMNVGTLVNMGVIPPDQLGNTIRTYVGINGPGPWDPNATNITFERVTTDRWNPNRNNPSVAAWCEDSKCGTNTTNTILVANDLFSWDYQNGNNLGPR